jgi:iron(III) transport system substrate-binding protein
VLGRLLVISLIGLILTACGSGDDRAVRLYTSVTEETVDAVVQRFESDTGIEVDVFRAPTGELAARLAAEQREGGVQADVLWLTDPLTMQQYAAEGLLRRWTPDGAEAVDPDYRTDTSWGTRLLSMVIVQRDSIPPLRSWRNLADPAHRNRIAAPDPGFAGSALAVLGYFAASSEYGLDFYRDLAANGLTVVNAPGEVVTGVAEGRFDAGITLDFSARAARDKGSPITIVWPEPGAITLHSPIAMVDGGIDSAASFIEFVLTRTAQQLIADTGWQPIRGDVPWATGGPQLAIDWSQLAEQRGALLDAYSEILGA